MKYTHLHDSEFVHEMIVVNEKTLAYWNKTEIVFIDFQGKELGTIKMPKEGRIYDEQLVSLGDGHIVAVTNHPQSLLFIKALAP